MRYVGYYDSPLGRLTMISDGEALISLLYLHQKYYAKCVGNDYEVKETPAIRKTREWLDVYFAGKIPKFTPPMKLEGTPFQMQVWDILKTIPYGEVVTYGAIAKQIAEAKGIERMSSQAVGGAVSHNPIAIIIPCHRVIGTDGKLTGYAGGLQRKTQLLDLEKNNEAVKAKYRDHLMEMLEARTFESFRRPIAAVL